MARDTKPGGGTLKVTDKRIFTSDGDIREEFLNETAPETVAAPTPQPPPPAPDPEPPPPPKPPREKGENPGTPYSLFTETLAMQGYMSLGKLRDPYDPRPVPPDLEAARQMIDILLLLQEKTRGNLTEEETEFANFHLDQLRLVFVQVSRTLGR